MMLQASKIVLRAVAGLLFGAGAAPVVMAQSLLDSAQQEQLAGWLGEGPLSLTAIYTKADGDTSRDFHLAADGKGRTFSVMEASNGSGQTWLVGGYNPQSWSSRGGFHVTQDDRARTGFLFNLTTGVMLPQLKQYFSGDTIGSAQTFNDIDYGPTFGSGHDLYVPSDLTHGGYSSLYTYNYLNQPASGTSLIDGSINAIPNITYGAMQIFSISAVPEPATYGMLLVGLATFAGLRRYRRCAWQAVTSTCYAGHRP